MTASPSTTTGELHFTPPGLSSPCKTWYKIIGDLSWSHPPLIILHGGPGASHQYLLVIAALASTHSIPCIFYDQLGTGFSTHLPEKHGDTAFWTPALFLNELDNLLTELHIHEYDLLGQSWGGMLAAMHAVRRPAGLRRLVLVDAIADVKTYVHMQDVMRESLPVETQEVLARCEREGRMESPEYQRAVEEFSREFVCRLDPWPEDVVQALAWYETDPTVYSTMIGSSDLVCDGSLRDWSIVEELHMITVPTLVMSGRYHYAQDWVNKPFFEKIEKVKWISFENATHITPHEEKDRFLDVVGDFLSG